MMQNKETFFSNPCYPEKPAYQFRAFHVDCARHYFPLDELKKMMDVAAYFQFNYFHWHISDDQGFRIESDKYPKLYEIGAYRNGDHFGNYDSDEPEGAYYTKEQVRELVRYGKEVGIEVIPEIDMPGHVTAILSAYPQLSCKEEPVSVGTKGGIYREIFCAGKESTYTFIEELLDEVMELFPGEYIHIGGDEAPKERWMECPHCRKRMEQEGFSTPQQLQGYMENRIAAYLKKHGRRAIVWNEAARGGNLDPDIVVQFWTEDKNHSVAEHMKKGGKVFLSNMMNSYCDYPYGFISLKSVYGLDMEPEDLKAWKEQIIGNECLIWTEYIRTCEHLEKLSWPRFAAAAAVGRLGGNRPDYSVFAAQLKEEFGIFEKFNICATPEEGWIPGEEETMRQIAEFKKNFSVQDKEELLKAQDEI